MASCNTPAIPQGTAAGTGTHPGCTKFAPLTHIPARRRREFRLIATMIVCESPAPAQPNRLELRAFIAHVIRADYAAVRFPKGWTKGWVTAAALAGRRQLRRNTRHINDHPSAACTSFAHQGSGYPPDHPCACLHGEHRL